MSNELISVIVPIYNTGKYLRKCLESLTHQTYKELEIILVNDGSTDSSAEICEEFSRKDKRIKVFNRRNAGLSQSRLFGLSMSRGKYKAFVDSDDYIAAQMLEKMYLRMKTDNSELVICNLEEVNESGDIRDLQPHPLPDKDLISGLSAIELLGLEEGCQLVSMCNKLYSEKSLSNICFPARMNCEDEMLIHRILYNCSRISLINEKLYFYVQREGSITASIDDTYILNAASAFLERCRFLSSKGLYSSALRALKGAVNLLYTVEVQPENIAAEKELVKNIRSEAVHLKQRHMGLRCRIKLMLLPEGKFIYNSLKDSRRKFR